MADPAGFVPDPEGFVPDAPAALPRMLPAHRPDDPFSARRIAGRDLPVVPEYPLEAAASVVPGFRAVKLAESLMAGRALPWLARSAATGALAGGTGGAVASPDRPAEGAAMGALGGAVLSPPLEALLGAVAARLPRRSPAPVPAKPPVSPVEPVETLPPARIPVNPEAPPAAVPARPVGTPEPWQQTRAEFHAGKNLHGSSADPNAGRANAGDEAGFFTTESEKHADFYANSETRNAVGGAGDIYAARPPVNPLDLTTQPARERLLAALLSDAEQLENRALDYGIKGGNDAAATSYRKMVQEIDPSWSEREFVGRVYDALAKRARALDANSSPIKGVDYLNKMLRDMGHDSFVTTEAIPGSGDPTRYKTTVYLDRPELVSHRQAVEQALAQGKPVPESVLSDYPDLAAKYASAARPVGTPGTGPVTTKNAQQFPALGDFAEAVRNDPATLERLKKLGGGRSVSNEETLRRALEIGPMHPDEVAAWPADAPMDHVTQTRILLTFDHFQQARNAAHMAGDLAAEAAAQREIARLIPGVYNARAMGGRVTQAQAMFVQDEMSKILDSLADMEAKGVPLEQARARANELLAQSEAAAKVAGAAKEWRDALGGLETAATWVKLTSPVTHMVNFTSNALTFGVVRPLEQAGRAATYLAQGNAPAAAAEAQALFGTRTGLLSGMKRWAAAVMDDAETGALSSEYGDRQIKLPRALRPLDVFRQLSGADAFWKGILEDSRLYQLAYRSAREAGLTGKALAARVSELRASPPQSWADEAASYAKEYTFQMDADAFLKKVQGIGNLPGMKFVLPFTKTPYNLQKFFMQRSPYGLASGRNLAGLKAGGQAQAEAVGRLAAGVGLSAGALALVSSTEATGAYPSDPRERERWKAANIREYSIKLPNGTWIAYNRFAPLGSYLGQAVALRDALARGEQNRVSALASGMLAATMKQTLDLPFMQSLSDLLDAVTGAAEPAGMEKKAPERFAQGVVTGLVPNVLRDVRQQTDPVMREARGVPQAVENMLPGLSQRLPASVDVLGRERTYEPDRLVRASKVLSTERTSPETKVFAALGWSPSAPSTTLELGKGKTTLTGEDAAQFRREMGEATAKAVRAFAARHKNLDRLDREDAVDALKKMVDDARKPVRRRWATRRVPLAEVVR